MQAQLRNALVGAVCVTLFAASAADARAPDDIENDATRLLISVQQLDPSDLAAGFRGSGNSDFVGQLADGELNYVLENYEQAGLVLAELVEHPDAFDEPGYPRALSLLGDSLYRVENFGLAQSYYDRLFGLDDDEYSLDAGLRLVEIELKKRDYEAAIVQLEEVEARYGDVAGDALIYVRGKVRYESGDLERSVQVFGNILQEGEAIEVEEGDEARVATGEYYARAQYLAGVAQTKLEEYDAALERFGALSDYLNSRDALSEYDSTVQQLTELAQARIYYEYGDWGRAVSHYAQVDPDSEQFDAALYEMSWTMINEERYMDAAYNLEVLSEISKDTRFVAESRLLAGNMKRRAEQYDEAETLFDSTGEDYGLIWRQLDSIVTSDANIATMYRQLQSIRTGGVEADVKIEDWVAEDPLVARSLLYVKNAAEIEAWLEEGREVVRTLTDVLGREDIYNIFPAASRFRGTMSTHWRRSVVLRAETVDEQANAARPNLTTAQQTDYASLYRERVKLMDEFAAIDFRVTVDDSARQASPTEAIDNMIAELGAAESELETAIDEIDDLQVLLRQRVGRGDMAPEEALQVERDLSSTRENLLSRLDQVRTQRRALLDERTTVAGTQSVDSAEDTRGMQLLRELLATLRAENMLLSQAIQSDGSSPYSEIYGTLDTVDAQLNALRGALGRALSRRRDVYSRMLNLERRRLAGMQQVLNQYSEEGTEVTSDIAKESILLTHERIGDVVLRANLGSIDVSWWQKESISQRIDELFDAKSRQLQILDADFAEILGGQ